MCWIQVSVAIINHFLFCRYTQVDADGHIAECLQAVLDFEQANNLVLD